MSVYEMAKQYYPRLWSRERLVALVKAGRLTEEEFVRLTEPQDATEEGADK